LIILGFALYSLCALSCSSSLHELGYVCLRCRNIELFGSAFDVFAWVTRCYATQDRDQLLQRSMDLEPKVQACILIFALLFSINFAISKFLTLRLLQMTWTEYRQQMAVSVLFEEGFL